VALQNGSLQGAHKTLEHLGPNFYTLTTGHLVKRMTSVKLQMASEIPQKLIDYVSTPVLKKAKIKAGG
jgi:hypothetical protein